MNENIKKLKLGDKVEKAIEFVAPKLSKKKCSACERRKAILNGEKLKNK